MGQRRFAGIGRQLRAGLLVAAAIGQLVLTVPLLSDRANTGMTMDMHGMHELGVFDFALGVAFLVGAFRPRLANGLAWPCAAAALGLVVTSAVDLVTHRTSRCTSFVISSPLRAPPCFACRPGIRDASRTRRPGSRRRKSPTSST